MYKTPVESISQYIFNNLSKFVGGVKLLWYSLLNFCIDHRTLLKIRHFVRIIYPMIVIPLWVVCWTLLVAFLSIPSSVSFFSAVHPWKNHYVWMNSITVTPMQSTNTYHMRSTKPPCSAIALFTRLANATAVSFGRRVIGGKYQTSHTIAQLVIIIYKYCIIVNLLLFQNASPNLGSYCETPQFSN